MTSLTLDCDIERRMVNVGARGTAAIVLAVAFGVGVVAAVVLAVLKVIK